MEIVEAFAFIKGYVVDWAIQLAGIICDIKHRGNKPMLIALSRKMPRFMDWISQTKADGCLPAELVKTISEVDLTTELAIPFIIQSTKIMNYEFIILDDVVVYGSTLRSVTDVLLLLTARKSHVSCLIRRIDSGNIDNVIQTELENIPYGHENEIDRFIDSISTIVEQTQLPIDLEFPIFSIDVPMDENYGSLVSSIVSDSFKSGLQAYPVGNSDGRFVIRLTDSHTIGPNTDFAKIRFFKKKNPKQQTQMVFETIAPMIFSQSELLSDEIELFNNCKYQKIWSETTREIRNFTREYAPQEDLLNRYALKSNFVRSLCVWASYLYSLSTYIYNAKNVLPFNLRTRVKLCLHDLTLVLGKVQAERIYSLLVSLIEDEAVSFCNKEKVLGIPRSFCPKPFETELLSSKILSAIRAVSITQIFIDIFKYQHYSNPKFSNRYISYERPFFGETYDSLTDATQTFFSGPENKEKLHRWIDENIDMGYVVPKYEMVKNKSGAIYWRRYFHPGIRKFAESNRSSI